MFSVTVAHVDADSWLGAASCPSLDNGRAVNGEAQPSPGAAASDAIWQLLSKHGDAVCEQHRLPLDAERSARLPVDEAGPGMGSPV